jgi:hypothetical protein
VAEAHLRIVARMNSSATTGRVSGDISVATTCPTAVTQATKTTAVGFPSCFVVFFVFFLKVYYDPPPLSSFFLIRNQLFANIFFFLHRFNRFLRDQKNRGLNNLME